ncbi:F11U15 [Hyposoter didymator ichnovirus]|nr:F11U15 [Hyposoter didymator ichnovirus]
MVRVVHFVVLLFLASFLAKSLLARAPPQLPPRTRANAKNLPLSIDVKTTMGTPTRNMRTHRPTSMPPRMKARLSEIMARIRAEFERKNLTRPTSEPLPMKSDLVDKRLHTIIRFG